MKRYLQYLFTSLGIMTVLTPVVAVAAPVDVFKACRNASSEVCTNTGANDEVFGANGIFSRIINTLFIVIGIIAVIIIIIGGLRYVLSAGDQNAVNNAKNTILYAVIGLIIAILAYAIVNFVVGAVL